MGAKRKERVRLSIRSFARSSTYDLLLGVVPAGGAVGLLELQEELERAHGLRGVHLHPHLSWERAWHSMAWHVLRGYIREYMAGRSS